MVCFIAILAIVMKTKAKTKLSFYPTMSKHFGDAFLRPMFFKNSVSMFVIQKCRQKILLRIYFER